MSIVCVCVPSGGVSRVVERGNRIGERHYFPHWKIISEQSLDYAKRVLAKADQPMADGNQSFSHRLVSCIVPLFSLLFSRFLFKEADILIALSLTLPCLCGLLKSSHFRYGPKRNDLEIAGARAGLIPGRFFSCRSGLQHIFNPGFEKKIALCDVAILSVPPPSPQLTLAKTRKLLITI
jgi:hypothetical protein